MVLVTAGRNTKRGSVMDEEEKWGGEEVLRDLLVLLLRVLHLLPDLVILPEASDRIVPSIYHRFLCLVLEVEMGRIHNLWTSIHLSSTHLCFPSSNVRRAC